jgi:hypothetical protein
MEGDRDFKALSIGHAAQTALDLMEEEIRDAQRQEDMRAFNLMHESRLTGEEALMAFARKYSLFHMHERLLAKVSGAKHAANRIRAREEANAGT